MPVGTSKGKKSVPDGLWIKCKKCENIIFSKELNENYKICPKCGYYFTLSAKERITLLSDSETFQEISKRNFRPIPVIVPSEPILKEFRERTAPLYRHIVENERESKALAQLRDTLLPKLISGELRIKDVEQFIERAG